MSDIIRTVELFAGVGGFRLGLENASERFKIIWANQWEPSMKAQYAFDCYNCHFGNKPYHVCQDISQTKKDIPEHDLLVGGFPCQDYSILKKNSKGIYGKKGTLWWQIDDILQARHPKYVVLENVDRLIRSPAKQYGRDISMILRCFYEKGYTVEWRIINASEYGYAQRRRRTFLVAYHNGTLRSRMLAERVCRYGLKYLHKYIMERSVLAQAFPVSTHGKRYLDTWIDEMVYQDIEELSHYQKIYLYNTGIMINGRIYSVDTVPKYIAPINLEKVLEDNIIDEHFYIDSNDIVKWQYAKGAKCEKRKRKDGSIYIFKEGNIPFPDPIDRPARTILTSESKLGRTSHVILDPNSKRLRTLTPVECERLNGFPDNWTDTGMPERMRYFCMGNALVVPLITRIGYELAKHITEE